MRGLENQAVAAVSEFDIAIAVVGLVAAGLVKGLTGIGYATCAMPFLALAVGLETAMALVVLPALVSNVAVLAGGRALLGVARRFWPFYVGILPGIALGVLLLRVVNSRTAAAGLGAVTLAYVALAVAKPQLRLSTRAGAWLALPAGWLNGVLTGLTGSQILPLVPYMLALRLPPETQVQAINLAVTMAAAVLGAALIANGTMTLEIAALGSAGAVLAAGGVVAGNALRGLLREGALRRLTLVMLTVISVSLLGRDAAEHAGDAVAGMLPSAMRVRAVAAMCPAPVPGRLAAFSPEFDLRRLSP